MAGNIVKWWKHKILGGYKQFSGNEQKIIYSWTSSTTTAKATSTSARQIKLCDESVGRVFLSAYRACLYCLYCFPSQQTIDLLSFFLHSFRITYFCCILSPKSEERRKEKEKENVLLYMCVYTCYATCTYTWDQFFFSPEIRWQHSVYRYWTKRKHSLTIQTANWSIC